MYSLFPWEINATKILGATSKAELPLVEIPEAIIISGLEDGEMTSYLAGINELVSHRVEIDATGCGCRAR